MSAPTREDVMALIVVVALLVVGLLGVVTSMCGCAPVEQEILPAESVALRVLERGGHNLTKVNYVETSVLCLQGYAVVVASYGTTVTVAQLWESAEQPLRCGPAQAKD